MRATFFNKRLAGRIKRKNVSVDHNGRLKSVIILQNSSFCNDLSNFNDVEGRTNTSCWPHAASGPRIPALGYACNYVQQLISIPGVNFINILRAAFGHVDPKSVKRYWGFDWILTLSGSTCVKAVLRMLMKLSPGVCWCQTFHFSLSHSLMIFGKFIIHH